jgi:hypothetical protein
LWHSLAAPTFLAVTASREKLETTIHEPERLIELASDAGD